MRYLNITHCDQVNGEGNRVVLWVAGCSHRCRNCQNPFSWDGNGGIEFDDAAKKEIFDDLSTDWCAGITYSGGDPLFSANRSVVISLAKEIRDKFPDKTQWLYTGYQWHEIVEEPTMSEIIKYVDVICDGEYIESLRDIDKHWVGSSNQNVIDVRDRLKRISDLSVGLASE